MSVSDTGSECALLDDMCLEPTLEVQEEMVFRAIALDSSGFAEGPHLHTDSFDDQVGALNSNTPTSKVPSIEVHESTSSAPAGPPLIAAPIPQPSNVILCSSAPIHFLPLLERVLQSLCIRSAPSTTEPFFGQFAKESGWRWRYTHFSQACSQIELEVSVWNTAPSIDCKPHLYSESPFAVEFQKMGGDTFCWNGLLSDLKRKLLQLDETFSYPRAAGNERPCSGLTWTGSASASPSSPKKGAVDEAGSVFDPLLGMLVQTENKRLQLEGLRACNLLVREDRGNLPKLINIFNEKTELFTALGDVLRGDSFTLPESQRIVLCILQMIAADSQVARENIRDENCAYRPLLERIGQEQNICDEMSVFQAKQILGL